MGMHGVLDGQRVQSENVCDRMHLVFVGLVQPDPHERVLARGHQFAGALDGRGVGVLARLAGAVDVDGAVDHGARHGDRDRLGVDPLARRPIGAGQRRRKRTK